MTLSLVAVVTDVIRDGKPVVGYGFNSNGRYGQGSLMRERFIPRVLEANPETLIDAERQEPRPAQDLGDDVDQREARRPRRTLGRRRHDRHGGVGRSGQDRRQAAVPTAGRALRQRQAEPQGSSSTRPAATTTPGRTSKPQGRDAQLPRPRLHGGQEEDRRRIARRRPAPHRRDPERAASTARSFAVDANGRFDLDTAIAYAKALSQYDLFWYEEPGDPLDFELQADARATTTRSRWPPAKTCSRCRTRAT